jgi:hypothetical protein
VLGSFPLLYIIFTPLHSPLPQLHLHFTPMSPSPTSVGDSPIWILFQTVLGVSTPRRPPLYCSPYSSPQSIVQVTLVCISGYVLARRGILDKSTQKVVTFISSHPPHRLICSFTAIKHHKRQLLHSLSTLLQSRLLPFPRSATILIDLANCSLFFPEKLRELWIIPIFFLLVTGVSLGVSWLLGNLFRLKPSQRYLLVLVLADSLLIFLIETLQWLLPHS